MAKLAFLGLGVMGYPMAGHLQKKGGHEVTVYNRTGAKAQQWAREFGGKHAASPREAAKDCDFVMMCVGNDDDVRSVAYGDNGVLAGMKRGAILVDHTTASALLAKELFAKAEERGVAFIDAPVSGGQAGAQNGQLGIMCGGEEAIFARAKPVIRAGARCGRITRRKVCQREAPRLAAASSNSLSRSWSTGWTVRTTNGRPMKVSATITPSGVKATWMPSGSSRRPIQPLREYTAVSAIPATAVGSANGRSTSASTRRLAGKR